MNNAYSVVLTGFVVVTAVLLLIRFVLLQQDQLHPSTEQVTVVIVDRLPGFGVRKLLRFVGDDRLEKKCWDAQPECVYRVPGCSVNCTWMGASPAALERADVLFFHGDEKTHNLTRAKQPPKQGQAYAVFGHEPTERFTGHWWSPDWVSLFDFTVHWANGADVPVTFFYFDELSMGNDSNRWWHLADVQSMWLNLSQRFTPEATDDVPVGDRMASAMVKNCKKTRKELLGKLIRLLSIASYGECHNNAHGDDRQTAPEHRHVPNDQILMDQKVDIISQHPFHLAMESTDREAGFVTEKIFQAFLAGTLPVYWGSSDVSSRVPPGSYIDFKNFESVEVLAKHLKELLQHQSEYMKYHAWRNDPSALTYFEWAHRIRRSTTPCRVCEYFSTHRKQFSVSKQERSLLQYSREVGFTRHSNTRDT